MAEADAVEVRDAGPADRPWIAEQLHRSWGSTTVVSRGRVHDASRLPAMIAVRGVEPVGLATLDFENHECELVSLDALEPHRGVGTALLERVVQEARARGCGRLWLITSNDNLAAVRFYQRRNLRLVAVHIGAIDQARVLKPAIPDVGDHGIPLHDELEFELRL